MLDTGMRTWKLRMRVSWHSRCDHEYPDGTTFGIECRRNVVECLDDQHVVSAALWMIELVKGELPVDIP